MQAIRVHQFGGIDALVIEDVPRPVPAPGELLLRVKAAGVGPWDAWIRAGRSVLPQPLPLTLGSDVAGIVVGAGAGVAGFAPGDAVFGATNPRFIGGYAEYAAVAAAMVAPMPRRASFVEAAAVPVVACTAWQMVFEHGAVDGSSRVLVLGGAGSVGACAVQLAGRAAREVVATASATDAEYVRALGAHRIVDARNERLDDALADVDVVLDTVGGELQARAFAVLRRGGVLVSAVSEPDRAQADGRGVRAFFFLVEVSSARLTEIAALIDAGALRVRVGEVLPLSAAVRAHEMLDGAPHARGKIVLAVDPS
jgi:NADPH:quinone reductase-like Zn-dependent oxidoreductase